MLTSVASSTALVCMQAVWAAVFARLAGETLPRRAWIGMAVALVGVVLVTGVDVSLSRQALLGDLLALVGGVFSGAYVVLGASVRRTVSTTAYTTLCYGTCAALLLVVCLVGGQSLGGYPAVEWWKLVALTLAAQLLGHSLFNAVLRRVSPTIVSLTILVEVPGAALLAAVFLGQIPPLAAVPALALILVGIAIVIGARDRAADEAGTAVVPTQ
jgi:drug/metabolite transporter (DMT)-like permease